MNIICEFVYRFHRWITRGERGVLLAWFITWRFKWNTSIDRVVRRVRAEEDKRPRKYRGQSIFSVKRTKREAQRCCSNVYGLRMHERSPVWGFPGHMKHLNETETYEFLLHLFWFKCIYSSGYVHTLCVLFRVFYYYYYCKTLVCRYVGFTAPEPWRQRMKNVYYFLNVRIYLCTNVFTLYTFDVAFECAKWISINLFMRRIKIQLVHVCVCGGGGDDGYTRSLPA